MNEEKENKLPLTGNRQMVHLGMLAYIEHRNQQRKIPHVLHIPLGPKDARDDLGSAKFL
jgi:hypothetical protein